MKRALEAALGIGFVIIGVLLAIAGLMGVLGYGKPISAGIVLGFVAVVMGLGMAGLGFIWVSVQAFEVLCDANGLTMKFVFTTRYVTWDQVDWYRHLWVKLTSDLGRGYLHVLLKYRQSNGRAVRVVLVLPGIGPAKSFYSDQYMTALDEFIERKRVRR
jgi:hypothetical protein